jgi:hypothetical protein
MSMDNVEYAENVYPYLEGCVIFIIGNLECLLNDMDAIPVP